MIERTRGGGWWKRQAGELWGTCEMYTDTDTDIDTNTDACAHTDTQTHKHTQTHRGGQTLGNRKLRRDQSSCMLF